MDSYGSSSRTPLSERFLTGGGDSIRGFERDHVGPRTGDGQYIGGDALLIGVE